MENPPKRFRGFSSLPCPALPCMSGTLSARHCGLRVLGDLFSRWPHLTTSRFGLCGLWPLTNGVIARPA